MDPFFFNGRKRVGSGEGKCESSYKDALMDRNRAPKRTGWCRCLLIALFLFVVPTFLYFFKRVRTISRLSAIGDGLMKRTSQSEQDQGMLRVHSTPSSPVASRWRQATRRFLNTNLDPTAPKNGYDMKDPSVIQFEAHLQKFTSCLSRRASGAENADAPPLEKFSIVYRHGLGSSWIVRASAALAGAHFVACDKITEAPMTNTRSIVWMDGHVDSKETKEWYKSLQHHQTLSSAAVSFGVALYSHLGNKREHLKALQRADEKVSSLAHRKSMLFTSTMPETHVWSHNVSRSELAKIMTDAPQNTLWFAKTVYGSNGQGVHVIDAPSLLPKLQSSGEKWLIQRYIDPLLLKTGSNAGIKFDVRFHALVRFFPLRIYMHDDGFVRFASEKLLPGIKHIKNKCMHLTAAGWQGKTCPNYKINRDAVDDTKYGMWSWHSLMARMKKDHFAAEKIWEKVKDVTVRSVIAAVNAMENSHRNELIKGAGAWQLVGPDIAINSNGDPIVEEVNVFPAMDGHSPLDLQVKLKMLTDMWWLLGADKLDRHVAGASSRINQFCNAYPILCTSQSNTKDILKTFEAELCSTGSFQLAYPIKTSSRMYGGAEGHWSSLTALPKYVEMFGEVRTAEQCCWAKPGQDEDVVARACKKPTEDLPCMNP